MPNGNYQTAGNRGESFGATETTPPGYYAANGFIQIPRLQFDSALGSKVASIESAHHQASVEDDEIPSAPFGRQWDSAVL